MRQTALSMGIEIERKFLIREALWQAPGQGCAIVQGYLHRAPDLTIRIRIADGQGFLTVKGASCSLRRSEFEYPVPAADAEAMLRELPVSDLVRKVRYRCPYGGHVWEVDVFDGDNAGLIVAEIELADEQEAFARPPWLDREVTGDHRYSNSNLAVTPYRSWPENATRTGASQVYQATR